MSEVAFGDNERISATAETTAAGYANQPGVCMGFATPSVTGVEVIGGTGQDHALSDHFDSDLADAFFAPELVQFVDNAPGTTIGIGDQKMVRGDDGEWSNVNQPQGAQAPKRRWFRRDRLG